ncbi:hypothetical protein MLGJGCBP_02120 [Rhodococcus sp. T7]|nr:hypothetical protein MLGJGCBP_02120 [Rhodococcus sp. T7]
MAAVGAGFLLGRRTAKLADSPEVAKLVETIRGELMPAAKAAAVIAVNSRIDSLNRRLESGAADPAAGARRRSDEVRNFHVVEAEECEEEPPAGDEPAEGEQKREDRKLPDNEGEEQNEGKFETDESDEAAQPEQEEPPRRSPRTRRTRGASTAKEIREWAISQGYEISARGRIPANIEQAFREAHRPPERISTPRGTYGRPATPATRVPDRGFEDLAEDRPDVRAIVATLTSGFHAGHAGA